MVDKIKNIVVSVLIANYNKGEYLMEAIESVRQQTYPNWEIVLVDDGSTDSSADLYKELQKDERIHIFYNNENKGCGFTKRRCVEMAHGELCGFLDPDDTLESIALEVMVINHMEKPSASMIVSRYNSCDSQLNVLWNSSGIMRNSNENLLQDAIKAVGHFCVFKKSLYNLTGGINPRYKRAVDFDMYYRLEEVGEKYYVDDILYNYRLDGNGLSQGADEKVSQYWHMFVIQEACQRRGINPEPIANKILMAGEIVLQVRINQLLNSRYYKLGYGIINPWERLVRKIKRMIV